MGYFFTTLREPLANTSHLQGWRVIVCLGNGFVSYLSVIYLYFRVSSWLPCYLDSLYAMISASFSYAIHMSRLEIHAKAKVWCALWFICYSSFLRLATCVCHIALIFIFYDLTLYKMWTSLSILS